MLSFTGVHITKEYGAPTVRDIAVQSMRMVRFGGGGRIFWPIGMHMMLVADIAEQYGDWFEAHALLHDSAEVAGIGDVCRPLKTNEGRLLENNIIIRIYEQIGLELPSLAQSKVIHEADILAVNAEGELGCGQTCYRETQSNFKSNKIANGLLRNYLDGLNPLDLLNADGKWPIRFERRLRRALRNVQSSDTHSRLTG